MFNNLAKSILFLSLSGSFMALAILLIKAVFYHKLSKKWFYYIWIIFAARLILPFGLPIQIKNNMMFQKSNDIASDHPSSKITLSEEISKNEDASSLHQSIAAEDTETGAPELKTSTTGGIVQEYTKLAGSTIGLLWFAICLFFLGKGFLCYIRYSSWVKHNSKEIFDEDVLKIYAETCETLGIKKKMPLLRNTYIGSPLLIGIVRPRIILPEKLLEDTMHLKYIFMHELIHYKRLDIYYKWLMQIVRCIHWFNPIVHMISREINKACEMSCDEAVIEKMSYAEQRAYGETLIQSMELASLNPSISVSITMVENVKHMKERLGAIMKYQRKSKITTCLAAFLTILICTGATFHVAYADTGVNKSEPKTIDQNYSVVENSIDQVDMKQLYSMGNNQSPKTDNASNDLSEVSINIPTTKGKIYVETYGKYSLAKDDKILTDLNWKGEGALMFLYTKESYSEEDIVELVEEGHLPLYAISRSVSNGEDNRPSLSANYAYSKNNKKINLNFITSPNQPIYWENEVPQTGSYYFYIIAEGNTGIKDIQGNISFSDDKKEDKKVEKKADKVENKEENKEDNKEGNKEGSKDGNKDENKLGHMKEWSGTASEEATETGIIFHAKEYSGDKIVYSFPSNRDRKVTLELKSTLKGDFEIVFITSDRTILKTVPAFTQSKEITLKQLPKGKIDMIIHAEKVSGSFSVDTITEDTASADTSSEDTASEDTASVETKQNSMIDIANTDTNMISDSGSFDAEDGQTLILDIKSDIKEGAVDLFLFDPDGKEQRIVIKDFDMIKEIKLKKGKWAYNCFGILKKGGEIRIKGTVK